MLSHQKSSQREACDDLSRHSSVVGLPISTSFISSKTSEKFEQSASASRDTCSYVRNAVHALAINLPSSAGAENRTPSRVADVVARSIAFIRRCRAAARGEA